jgi:hypothetical protein
VELSGYNKLMRLGRRQALDSGATPCRLRLEVFSVEVSLRLGQAGAARFRVREPLELLRIGGSEPVPTVTTQLATVTSSST